MKNVMGDHERWLWVAGVLFTILIVGPAGNAIWGWSRIWPWAVVAFVTALCMAWWRWTRIQAQERIAVQTREWQEQRQQFEAHRGKLALCKPVIDLRPSDFRFQDVKPGEAAERDRRPFYRRYVSRRMVLAESTSGLVSPGIYTERSVLQELRAGRSVVILGPPTMGKSRTLYEVITGLRDWMIISPWKDRPPPSVEALRALVRDQKIVLMLEDLNDFAGGGCTRPRHTT